MSNSTSTIGRVLIIGAGVLVVITVIWLFVAGTTAGGKVLCLGLAAPVFLVMIAGGFYLNRQGAAQQAEQKSLEQQWAWRDDERRARLYVAERLEQAAARLAASGKAPAPFIAELRGLADRLRRPGYEQGVPPTISPDAYQALKSLDASLMAEADKLDQATDTWLNGDESALRNSDIRLRQMVDRRTEILLGPTNLKTAREILAGGPTSAVDRGNVQALAVNDAVSAGGEDYSVTGRLAFNDRGVQWSRLQLRSGGQERWLLAMNGGLDTYWLTPVAPPGDAFTASTVTLAGGQYTLRGEGTAEVALEGLGGERRGMLIDYRRFLNGDDLLWAERWTDGQTFAFTGQRVGPYEIDVFQQRKTNSTKEN
ncbi:MAG: DUF4178 domain-containing protein [Anaerolineae bacterium]